MGAEKQPDITVQLARAAGRFSSDKALRKRVLRAGVSGVAATVASVGRVVGKLWHEVTGFLFLCLAAIGGAEVWRKWSTHETQKLEIAAAFSAMFLYFGVSSFWRAKRPKAKLTAEAQSTRRKS
jgi:hypothetical protein